MNSCFLRCALICVTLLYALQRTAIAHVDPEGEVHPIVIAENGNFVVYFRINKEIGSDDSTFKRVFGAAGNALKWKHLASMPNEAERKKQSELRRQGFGRTYQLDSLAKSITILENGKMPIEHSMAWPNGKPPFKFYHDYAVVGDRIFILAYPEGSETHSPRKILTLYSFETKGFRLVESMKLGEVAAIYERPTASPLLPAGGQLVFAWMGVPDGSSDNQFLLTEINPATMTQKMIVLDGTYQWNTSISLAAIGNRICIAWHDGAAYGEVRKAKIRTVFETIDASP